MVIGYCAPKAIKTFITIVTSGYAKSYDYWAVAFKNSTGSPVAATVHAACSLNSTSIPCTCVDDSPKVLGFAIYECPDRASVDVLDEVLSNEGYPLKYIEIEQRVEGAPAAGRNISELMFREQALAACSDVNPFSFPQINPPNWGLDRCDQVDPELDNSFDIQGGLIGCGVYLYVMDTGVNPDHTEFQGRIRPGKDTTRSGNNPEYRDDAGHGKHMTPNQKHGYLYGADMAASPSLAADESTLGQQQQYCPNISQCGHRDILLI